MFGLGGTSGNRAKLTEADARIAAEVAAFGRPVTPDTAMRVATVWACVRLLAESIGTLPLGLYRKKSDGSREVAGEHGLYSLLHDSPNADQSAVEFWEAVVSCLALWGNYYAEKARNGVGDVIALNFMQPDLVTVYRDANGARRYRWVTPKAMRDMSEDDVFHVRGFGIGLDMGLSPIGYARSTLGAAMAADHSAASAFQNSVRPSGLLIYSKGTLTAEQRVQVRQQVLDPLTGPSGTGRAGILEAGFDWKDVTGGLPPGDLQLLETRAFHVEEICRWFRVPPFMVGQTEKSTSWGTGLEQQMIGFLTFSLRPYLSRIEQAVKKQLVPLADRGTIYAEFNLEGLMRADSAGRAALYASAADHGWMTRDEIRAFENMPSLSGGDKLTVNAALVPLDQLGADPAAQPASSTAQRLALAK